LSLSEQTSKWQLETPILKVRENFEAKKIIKQIGGTIKIGQELKSKLTEKQMLETAIAELLEKTGKIHFGLSVYGNIDLNKIKNWAKEIKKEMTAVGRSVRFVFKNESVLSSVTVDKNNLIEKGAEFLIIKNTDNLYSIAKTLTVQPFEELGRRDFGRPGRNSRSGMLPPKLAMMLINLSNMSANKTLLDPFCGSGTIVTEALLMDYKKIIGSDISNQAIIDTHKNIAWLKPNNETKIFVADVNDLTKHIKPASVDTIVTEPYLGQPLRGNEVKQILEKQTDELKKIYLSAFEIFKKILKQNGTIIFIIPRFKFRNEWIKIDCQKEIEKIGFSTESLIKFKNEKYFSLLYWRDNQHLGREIWKFKKN